MPAETEPHERTWMAFPTAGYTLGDDDAAAEEARAAWAAVAHAVAEFEPVTMVVDPSAVDDARRHLGDAIDLVVAPLDDAWMRDIGPTFVVPAEGAGVGVASGPRANASVDGAASDLRANASADGVASDPRANASADGVASDPRANASSDGVASDPRANASAGTASGLAAVDWIFNGWGAQTWATWGNDREIGGVVGRAAGAAILPSMLVNEGGAIHTDGDGTVLVTETVQLDPGRNPHADRARIEAELARTLGARRVIWLPRGLTRDYDDFGTRGHVDMVAAFPSPGVVLVHDQQDPAHPDHEVSRLVKSVLSAAVDARGRRLTVVDLPAPRALRDDVGWVDHSYVNHYVVNGGVIACGFGDASDDARAAEVLASVYPGRRVVTVDARPLFDRGGGIHCITQQQPAV